MSVDTRLFNYLFAIFYMVNTMLLITSFGVVPIIIPPSRKITIKIVESKKSQ